MILDVRNIQTFYGESQALQRQLLFDWKREDCLSSAGTEPGKEYNT